MEYTFSFSVLCQPRKDKKMVTQSIDSARKIAQAVTFILKTISSIMKPYANYTFWHVSNNKDYQYDYVINISAADKSKDYQSIGELVFIILHRELKSLDTSQDMYITVADIDLIEKIAQRKLTDQELLAISSQICAVVKTITKLSSSLIVDLFRGDQASSDFTLTDDPTKSSKRSKKLIDHVDDNHIERLSRTKIKFRATINTKSGNLNLTPYLPNNKRIYLSYISIAIYGKLANIINEYECFEFDVLLDVNAHVDGYKYVHDAFPPVDVKHE